MGYTMPPAVVLRILSFMLLFRYAHSCLYFQGSNVSQQMLVIDRDRKDYCILKATTKDGEDVPCDGSVTATRINDTHVRLNTEEGLENAKFFMNYGTNGTPLSAEPYEGDCPSNSTAEPENQKTAESSWEKYGLYLTIGLVIVVVIIIIISVVIHKKCKTDNSQSNGGRPVCNGVSVVKYTKGAQEDTVHVQQNGSSSH